MFACSAPAGLSFTCILIDYSLFFLASKVLALWAGLSSSCRSWRLVILSEQLYFSSRSLRPALTVRLPQQCSDLRTKQSTLRAASGREITAVDAAVTFNLQRSLVLPTGQLVGNEVSQLSAHLPAARHFFLSIQNAMQSRKLAEVYKESMLITPRQPVSLYEEVPLQQKGN